MLVESGVKYLTFFLPVFFRSDFDDLFKNLENNQELYDFVYDILILNERVVFEYPTQSLIWEVCMGYLKMWAEQYLSLIGSMKYA